MIYGSTGVYDADAWELDPGQPAPKSLGRPVELKVGQVYRHYLGGRLIEVLDVHNEGIRLRDWTASGTVTDTHDPEDVVRAIAEGWWVPPPPPAPVRKAQKIRKRVPAWLRA